MFWNGEETSSHSTIRYTFYFHFLTTIARGFTVDCHPVWIVVTFTFVFPFSTIIVFVAAIVGVNCEAHSA
jgi:hypothetical protein